MKYTGDGKFIQVSVLCAKYYQHRTWFDRVIYKIKRVPFFSSQVHKWFLLSTLITVVVLGVPLSPISVTSDVGKRISKTYTATEPDKFRGL